MMEREEFGDLERELSNGEQSRSQTRESDNAWQFGSVPEETSEKWRKEKERYDEMIEYIREVDDILNLIRPFPREAEGAQSLELPPRSDSRSPRFGFDHLENIIKLVEQLKELQENNYKSGEKTCYLKDLKRLREHKKRLKSEELEMKNRARVRSAAAPDEYEACAANRKSSSTSEKLERAPKENWQDKRKSICLGENRSKVSKWTKVKEAFHWEKTSTVPKALRRGNSPGENPFREEGGRSGDASPDEASAADVFCSPPLPPLPPPPPPPPRLPRPEDSLSVQPTQDFPSSSSSDRLDEFLSFSEIKESKTSDPDSPSHPFCPDDIEEIDTPRRKSCDEITQQLNKEDFGCSRSTKSNKTTWGKVKDIIQTRKDSLKKKPKKRGSDEFKKRRKLSTVSNPQFSDQFEDLSSPEDKVKNTEIIPESACDFSEEPLQSSIEEKCVKRLTPALTVTLPSTEELRSFSYDDTDKRESAEEDKSNVFGEFSCQAQYCEDKSKFGKNKSGSNQRLSRWIKVKRVFLTSGTSARSPQFLPVNSSSSPTSQNKSSGFFSDLESDELSSGEWIDDKSPSQEKQKLGFPESESTAMTLIQEDIRRSYNELQKKLSQEFDQKLREWEVKNEVPAKQEDSHPKAKGDDGDCIQKFRKTRDSITVPLPNLNDLSPEFKKKLNDWKKMKMSQSSSSVSSSATKDDIQGQNIRIRIGEWQPWRNRCSGKGVKGDQGLSEDFSKKFEEAQKTFGNSRSPPNRRKDEEGGFAASDNRRGSKRRDSVKKLTHSRTSSGGNSLLSTTSTEKDGKFIRRSQKVKDFHWVEKELQKIEREKLRLEQEKEKYLEREARLEKMKKTMGTIPAQEILVRTPEGFFRFKGISQKFTKKLYEWEKARGIAPEASTFALLEESAQKGTSGDADADGVSMQRSKSTGSVPELSSTLLIQSMAHQPSSLSLNDVDELKREEEESISVELKGESEEPEAIIVDVEDIEEETAVLAESPSFHSETPIYTYTSEEIEKMREAKGRFYFSGEFGMQITERRDASRGFGSSVQVFEKLAESDFREANLRLMKAEKENVENLLGDQETEKTVMLGGATKEFWEEEEEKKGRKISEEAFQASGSPTCGFLKPKGFYDLKAGKTKNSDDLPLPASQRGFSQWMSETENPVQNRPDPEALKRKIKEKISLMQKMSTEASWKYAEVDHLRQKEKTRRSEEEETFEKLEKSGSVSIFVPTTRKIISPVKTTNGATPSVCSYVIDDVKSDTPEKLDETTKVSLPAKKLAIEPSSSNSAPPAPPKKCDPEANQKKDIGMPPLPNSPKTFKKLSPKETAPSIRMIIAKYNQKISEHDGGEGKRAESGSPIWRSPVFGRRTQEKIERFCGKDDGSGRRNGEVQKSASLDNVRGRATSRSSPTPPQDHEPQLKGILKSSSAGVMRIRPQHHEPSDAFNETSPSVLRAMRIQKAKEDFFSGRLDESSDASTVENIEAEPQIRITQPEAEPEQSLGKSVSAETITGESSQGEIHPDEMADGRTLHKSSSKFDISSIKSKFRKMRMRREKDSKLNAVAVLCRQSLFIEVPKASESSTMSKSCPSSPVMDRNKREKPTQPSKK